MKLAAAAVSPARPRPTTLIPRTMDPAIITDVNAVSHPRDLGRGMAVGHRTCDAVARGPGRDPGPGRPGEQGQREQDEGSARKRGGGTRSRLRARRRSGRAGAGADGTTE